MQISKKEIDEKLNHILQDIKGLQKIIIRMKLEEKGVREDQLSRWELLGREVSSKWVGPTAAEEIRTQREKKW